MPTSSFNDEFVIRDKEAVQRFKESIEKVETKLRIRVFNIEKELNKGEQKLKEKLKVEDNNMRIHKPVFCIEYYNENTSDSAIGVFIMREWIEYSLCTYHIGVDSIMFDTKGYSKPLLKKILKVIDKVMNKEWGYYKTKCINFNN
jgi:predicted acetyltransferase